MAFCTPSIRGPVLQSLCIAAPQLCEKEMEYLNRLKEMPIQTFLLSVGKEEEKLHQLGQEIFDYFASRTSGPEPARQALHNIANALISACEDGKLRRKSLDLSWSGVGNLYWRWHFLSDGYQ